MKYLLCVRNILEICVRYIRKGAWVCVNVYNATVTLAVQDIRESRKSSHNFDQIYIYCGKLCCILD